MDYMINGYLAENMPEEKTEDKLLTEYLKRLQKEKEETADVE